MYQRLIRLLLCLLAVPLLSGCNPTGIIDFIDSLLGGKKQTIVLLRVPLVINEQPRTFVSHEPKMTVMGSSTSVCVVLAGDTELGDTMEQVANNHLNGARLQATLFMDDGTQHVLDGRGLGWQTFGNVVKKGELVACAIAGCAARPPVGSTVARMTLSATKPVKTLGVYWESRTMPGEKAEPKPSASASAQAAPKNVPKDGSAGGTDDKSTPRSTEDQKQTRC